MHDAADALRSVHLCGTSYSAWCLGPAAVSTRPRVSVNVTVYGFAVTAAARPAERTVQVLSVFASCTEGTGGSSGKSGMAGVGATCLKWSIFTPMTPSVGEWTRTMSTGPERHA